jgi:hypothetical protein
MTKQELQRLAGIPHLPTDLTYELRLAVSGEGPRAYRPFPLFQSEDTRQVFRVRVFLRSGKVALYFSPEFSRRSPPSCARAFRASSWVKQYANAIRARGDA